MQLCRAQSWRWTPPTPPALSGFKAHAHPRRLHRMALRVSSNSDAPSTSAAQQEDRFTVEQLQQQMADAVASEKYDVAAAIRDQLLSLDVSQPEDVLKLQLKAAIAGERFSVRCSTTCQHDQQSRMCLQLYRRVKFSYYALYWSRRQLCMP